MYHDLIKTSSRTHSLLLEVDGPFGGDGNNKVATITVTRGSILLDIGGINGMPELRVVLLKH